MNALNFTYWLQGYCELAGAVPNETQWKVIQDHLKIVDEIKTIQPSTQHVASASSPVNHFPVTYC